MSMNYKEIPLQNPGILVSELPESTFQELLETCNRQIEKKDVAKALKRNLVHDDTVQGIEEALHINLPNTYTDYLSDFAVTYAQHFNINYAGKPHITNKWLNLQKKFEYRPMHLHSNGSGINLSFVTYIKVPYLLETEDQYINHNKKAKVFRNGRIEFSYNTFTGKQNTHALNIDQSWEGRTILFLNSLMHIVYPFYTSDEYRISLAGNISINN